MALEAPTLGELESAADTARAVMAEMAGKGEPPAKEVVVDDGHRASEAPPADVAGDKPGDGRPRDEKGRFAAREADKPVDAKAGTKAAAEPDAVQPAADKLPAGGTVDSVETPPEGDDEPPLEPLADWSAADHEAFRSLPRAQQKFILDRAQAAQKAAAEAQVASGRYSALEQVLAPRRQFFARDGLDDAGAMRQLFALSDFAAQQPTEFARWFLQNRGITPEQLWPMDGALETQIDPNIAALKQEVDSLRGYIQNQQQSSASASQQHLQTELANFREARDAQGRLEHPYFEQVRRHMGGLMGAGVAPDLKTAYDMACRADPEVSAKMASAQRARDEAERARQNRAKAAAASKAGASVSGTPADRPPPDDTGDPREMMRRLAAERGLLS